MHGPVQETRRADVWASGEAYEAYVGRWSRLVAGDFLRWLGVPACRRWLDVGCGTGALTATILSLAEPVTVVGVDPSAGYVEYARDRIEDSRAAFAVGDGRSLPVGSAAFDAAISGLALNFVPEPDRAVSEMARAVRPGGAVGAYVWDYAGEMQLMRRFWDAAVALDTAAAPLDEGVRFRICNPTSLGDLFEDAGLAEVHTGAIDVPTVFRDFDDYWAPFIGGQGPAPGYAMSLDEERRAALRERIRADLPSGPDGSIWLIARAWAVGGRRRRV
jgi:SAM-dependent methyltransferase